MIPRYPRVTAVPVSANNPAVQDVLCTACGMTHAAQLADDAPRLVLDHRFAHFAYTAATVTATLAAVLAADTAADFLGAPGWASAGLIVLAGAVVLMLSRPCSPCHRQAD